MKGTIRIENNSDEAILVALEQRVSAKGDGWEFVEGIPVTNIEPGYSREIEKGKGQRVIIIGREDN